MPKSDEKLKKLKSLLELSNFGMTREEFLREFKQEFLDSLKTVIDQVLKVEAKMIKNLNNVTQELKNNQNKQTEVEQENFRILTGKFEGVIDKALREQENGMKFIYDKIQRLEDGKDGKDGQDGKDADEEKIVKEVLNKIEIPKLEIENIDGLKKELEDLRNIRTRKGGGGTSAIGIANAAKYFVKTEEPSGAIDGTNTQFSVNKPIFAVLAFVINGEYVARLPNFTVSGKTITFSTAIPSAYNGKDVEVVYI